MSKSKATAVSENRRKNKYFRDTILNGVRYKIKIDDWRCDYSFGLNANYDPHRADPAEFHTTIYSELFEPILSGTFLEPKQLRGEKCEISFYPDKSLNLEDRERNWGLSEKKLPAGIAVMHRMEEVFWIGFPVPDENFSYVLQSLLTGKITYVCCNGEKSHYNRATIYGYSLQRDAELVPDK